MAVIYPRFNRWLRVRLGLAPKAIYLQGFCDVQPGQRLLISTQRDSQNLNTVASCAKYHILCHDYQMKH